MYIKDIRDALNSPFIDAALGHGPIAFGVSIYLEPGSNEGFFLNIGNNTLRIHTDLTEAELLLESVKLLMQELEKAEVLREIRSSLEIVNQLKDLIKARSSIYQIDAKERAAELCKLPHWVFYELPYVEWVAVQGVIGQFQQAAEDSWKRWQSGSSVQGSNVDFSVLPKNPLMGEIWTTYRDQVGWELNLEIPGCSSVKSMLAQS